MKSIKFASTLFIALMLLTGYTAMSQTTAATTNNNQQTSKPDEMKTYLIERDIPNAGSLTPDQLKAISQKSCSVLKKMGPDIQWIQSYVTADKIFCVYKAKNEELIKEHAKEGGFPANKITEVDTQISPATAGN